MSAGELVRVDVWSDIVCPFCYIGKRRLDRALAQSGRAAELTVVWHSFELDPARPKGHREPVHTTLEKKTGGSPAQVRAMTRQVTALGAEEGLDYHLDRAVVVNTFDAHRLTRLAETHGLGAEMHERLMRAHLVEGQIVDDRETLVRLATEVGVPGDEADRTLATDGFAEEVAADGREARRLGANGVPFFVFDRRYGFEGAQSFEVFRSALGQALEGAR